MGKNKITEMCHSLLVNTDNNATNAEVYNLLDVSGILQFMKHVQV